MSDLEKAPLYGVLHTGTVVPLLCVIVLSFRDRVGPRWLKGAFALGVLLSAVRLYFLSLSAAWGVDHAILRRSKSPHTSFGNPALTPCYVNTTTLAGY